MIGRLTTAVEFTGEEASPWGALKLIGGSANPELSTLISEKLDLPYENPGDGVPAEVVELARAGERIDAVKRYRALTGASLDVAHDVVSKL